MIYKVGDIVNCLDYRRIPVSSKERENRKGIYPYYGAQGIVDYIDDYIFDGAFLLVAEDGENLRSNNEPIARIARGKYWVNNHAHILESNGKCDIRYLCYCLNTINIRGYITGSAQPKLNQDNLLSISINLPPLEKQVYVADVLDVLDRKISLNTRMNAELEAMAKQLYDYWFVQFDFPDENGKPYKSSGGKMVWNEKRKREIPEGWEDATLFEIANITMGQSPDGSTYNTDAIGMVFYQGSTDFGIRFPSVRMFTTNPTRFASKGDILMSVRAPVGDTNIANENCCIGRGLSALNSKIGSTTHLYHILSDLKAKFAQLNAAGTTFGSITKDEMYSLPVVKPSSEVLKSYEDICYPMFEKQMNIDYEINRLTHLRDSLLPMLMNGQVTIE